MAPLRRAFLAALILAPSAALAGPPVPAHAKPPAGKPPAGATAIKAPRTAHLAPAPERRPPGVSVGSPTQGHLVGGAHLADAPYLRVVPSYAGGDVRWGLEPLVGMIDRAARSVRRQFPDAVLSVGHLSKPGGGELERHASHESGRDADIGFYVKNQAGKPVHEDRFVAFGGDGAASSWPGARFDDAKNWALVAAIVGDGSARVTHVFVSTAIRARLLAYAAKIGAPDSLRNRAAELMAQPKGSLPHDDHFHVRIACPTGMDRCIELPTARHRHGASKPPHAIASAPPKVAARKPEPRREKSEPTVPSLTPEVPGLDSAVIATPLVKPDPSEPPKVDEPAHAEPIDDPDGVLESR